jgi:carboxyl-terminal processing protease
VREADLRPSPRQRQGGGRRRRVKAKRDELEEEQQRLAALKNAKPLEFGGKDDFQLAQAINHFKGLPVKLAKADPDGDDKPASRPNCRATEPSRPSLKPSPKALPKKKQ